MDDPHEWPIDKQLGSAIMDGVSWADPTQKRVEKNGAARGRRTTDRRRARTDPIAGAGNGW